MRALADAALATVQDALEPVVFAEAFAAGQQLSTAEALATFLVAQSNTAGKVTGWLGMEGHARADGTVKLDQQVDITLVGGFVARQRAEQRQAAHPIGGDQLGFVCLQPTNDWIALRHGA